MKTITFSVVIPLQRKYNKKALKINLDALDKQTLKPLEIILIHDSKSDNKPSFLTRKCKYFAMNTSKSEARNLGAKKARGTHLVNIDTDYVLPPTILEKAAKKLSEGSDAVIMHETIKSPKSIWQKARKLERDIALHDLDMCAPQIISKKMFTKIGGFDEEVDELDDWALHERLVKNKASIKSIISPLTPIHEPTNVKTIFKRKFNKGRYLHTFKAKYTAPQISFIARASTYIDYLYHNPSALIYSIPLALLKVVDQVSFRLGSYFPITQTESMDTLYKTKSVAETFDIQQRSIYGKLKHYWEVAMLLTLLQDKEEDILELGSGTGRITKVLSDKGYKITPTDVSEEMLKVLREKVAQKPIHITSEKLPFKNGQFNTVLAMRVIWHIENEKKREKFFSEAVRVAKNTIIMDFAIQDMGINSILKRDYFYTEEEIVKLSKKCKLKIEKSYWLPLGRKLYLFSK